MRVNSIGTNHKQQSFGGIYFHNKPELVKTFSKSIDKLMKEPHIKEIAQSSEYNIHIKPKGIDLAFCITKVGHGLKGLYRNFMAPWERFCSYLGKSQIENYKTNWHPTPERLAQLKKLEKEAKIRRNEIRLEEQARIKTEKAEIDKGVQQLTDIEKSNNK